MYVYLAKKKIYSFIGTPVIIVYIFIMRIDCVKLIKFVWNSQCFLMYVFMINVQSFVL